jgi:hypothetical protein
MFRRTPARPRRQYLCPVHLMHPTHRAHAYLEYKRQAWHLVIKTGMERFPTQNPRIVVIDTPVWQLRAFGNGAALDWLAPRVADLLPALVDRLNAVRAVAYLGTGIRSYHKGVKPAQLEPARHHSPDASNLPDSMPLEHPTPEMEP